MRRRIIVVGSGVIGSAIAYELSSNPQLEITLIDENDNPGSGATGAALGVLMGIISLKTKGRAWTLREASVRRYHQLIPELEELTGLSIPHNKDGTVKLLLDQEEITKYEKLAQLRASQGYSLQLWDIEKLRQNCPELDISATDTKGAVYSPYDWQVSPTPLTKALVKGASIKGVQCILGKRVIALRLNKSGVCEGVELEGHSLSADYVILATGLGTTPLVKPLGVDIRIEPVLGQALLLKYDKWSHPEGFNPVISGDDIHIAPLGDGQFWLGATVEFPSGQESEPTPSPDLLQQLYQRATEFYPNLKQATIMLSWTGQRPHPQGKPAPVIEKLSSHPNVILATGHYRNGILLAPATAQTVRQMIEAEI
ncbi:MAG: FAD-binding oxidoreductase [Geminocystis sp.]|nr:FAD-binding oxidoreductase [Geminocystis sp.]MCS7147292.1 FAD-binding oxidoreductase [Geminocystis sp.]MDW8116291.1 FAD-dependent oxidoreductase [Geminocystis sp.]MDW8462718.1 FAD-dependent oxidoreductase [Geminocystis sp.]